MKNTIIGLLIIFITSINTLAQDIESIAKAPVLTTSGGFSMNQITTITPGDTTANDNPFALFLSGNLNFNMFGTVSVPLSFSYTNQQLSKSVSLPFNRFSIAPSYKWIKVYAGYASMQFSPYSLAGHELFGGGVELTPDNGFKISAIYGRLKKQSFGEDGTDPAFKRMGGGFDVEYKKERFEVGVNLFKAQDVLSPQYLAQPDSMDIMPQDNLTGSVKVGINFIKDLQLMAEYGISALNRNINSNGDATGNSFHLLKTDGDLAVYHALKTSLTYTKTIGSIGATYERVDPNYTTLGAYYMTNDYENITANFSTSIIKKFNIAVDGGYQRDNLEKQKNNTASRLIYSANISSNLTEKLNLALNLSNIQSYIYINDVYSQVTQTNEYQNLDTLNVTQLNYTLSFNSAYVLQSTNEKRQGVNLNLMYQRSAEAQQYSRFSGNDIYNTSVSYQFSLLPVKFNASTSVSYNYNKMPDDYTQAFTYNLSLQKTFFSELRSGLIATYSNMANQAGKLSDVINLRLSEAYLLAKKHNFNLSLILLYSDSNLRKRTQYAANLSYSYNFNVTLDRKDKKLKLDYSF